jgi:hypothetical protein
MAARRPSSLLRSLLPVAAEYKSLSTVKELEARPKVEELDRELTTRQVKRLTCVRNVATGGGDSCEAPAS